MAVSSPPSNSVAVPNNNTNYGPALVVLTSLFFMWGFITCLNDILIPHLKAVFDLNYTQVMLVQFTFFTAYAIVSLPSGILVEKIGYKTGIIIGLLTAAAGTALILSCSRISDLMEYFYLPYLFWLPELLYCKLQQILTLQF